MKGRLLRREIRLIPIEVYHEAMIESLRNAKALVEEAVLVARQVSMTHGLMLRNLAIEEAAKAHVCWLVVAGILPRNHPMVKTLGKKSVFRNHDVKNAVYLELANSINLDGMKRAGEILGDTDPEQLAHVMGYLSSVIGRKGTEKRFEWMYVDIVEEGDGSWSVSSPLKMDKENQSIYFKNIKDVVRFLEIEIQFLRDARLHEYRDNMREFYKENDSDFPDKPKW